MSEMAFVSPEVHYGVYKLHRYVMSTNSNLKVTDVQEYPCTYTNAKGEKKEVLTEEDAILIMRQEYDRWISKFARFPEEYTTFDESIIKVEGEGGTLEADGSVTRIPGFRLSIRKIM